MARQGKDGPVTHLRSDSFLWYDVHIFLLLYAIYYTTYPPVYTVYIYIYINNGIYILFFLSYNHVTLTINILIIIKIKQFESDLNNQQK